MSSDLSTRPRVVAIGECMIELSEAGPGLLRQSFGGDTLNTAVYLARLAQQHFDVSYATAVGRGDGYSEAMTASWEAEGVDTGFVARHDGELPGLYTIQVDANGERRFAYWRQNSAARHYLSRADCPLLLNLGAVDVLYVSGISLAILPPDDRSTLLALMARQREQGRQVVFDNNYRPRLWPDADAARAAYREAMASASTALITLDDDLALFGDAPEAQALAACRARCPAADDLVIKRGARPTLVAGPGQAFVEVEAVRVPRVVDTTAAGDSFGAGYLAARLKGAGREQAAAAGNQLAAVVIQHRGAIIDRALMP